MNNSNCASSECTDADCAFELVIPIAIMAALAEGAILIFIALA